MRAHLIRLAIAFASLSVLLAALLVIALFLAALFRWEVGLLIAILFVACMCCLIGSLIAFMRDVNRSLVALKMVTASARPGQWGQPSK